MYANVGSREGQRTKGGRRIMLLAVKINQMIYNC